MKARNDIGQGKKNTCIIKYTLLCKFLRYVKLCKCKLLVMFCFIYSWKKWFYSMIYKVYCKQVNTLSYSFGVWNELIFFTLFLMGKYDSVFEQFGFRTAFQNELCS